MGGAAKISWRQVMLYACAEAWRSGAAVRVLCRILRCGIIGLTLWLVWTPDWISGNWADQAFSEVMSQKAGAPVRIEGVRFLSWGHVRFGHTEIRNAEGRLLVSAASGKIILRRLSIRKDGFFETEIYIRGAEFTREFYRNAHRGKFWTRFMRRPLKIESLKAQILQNDANTSVRILECRSADVGLGGEMIIESSGAIKDCLRTSMTPRQFISTV